MTSPSSNADPKPGDPPPLSTTEPHVESSTVDGAISSRFVAKAIFPRAPFRTRPKALSFDVFGFALTPTLLDPGDIHPLVGSTLAELTTHDQVDAYVAARLAAADGRVDFALPMLADQLASELVARSGLDIGAGVVAAEALRTEARISPRAWQPNPDARALYREARAANVLVAFIADTLLPRDLVARMLVDSGYDGDHVLVSSHLGTTKASGALFKTLIGRLGLPPDRITHIGPNAAVDVDVAAEAGLNPIHVRSERGEVLARLLGPIRPNGADSIALSLATDRLVSLDPSDPTAAPSEADIGYFVGGPLFTGLASWLIQLIDERSPQLVLVCGALARLIGKAVLALRPGIAGTEFHVHESPLGQAPDPKIIDRLVDRLSPTERAPVLVADLGWAGIPHRSVVNQLTAADLNTPVIGAYLAAPPSVYHHAPEVPRRIDEVTTWLDGPAPSELIETVSLLIDGDMRTSGFAAGIDDFVSDFALWTPYARLTCSPALAEPATRIGHAPTPGESSVIDGFDPTTIPPTLTDRVPIRRLLRRGTTDTG